MWSGSFGFFGFFGYLQGFGMAVLVLPLVVLESLVLAGKCDLMKYPEGSGHGVRGVDRRAARGGCHIGDRMVWGGCRGASGQVARCMSENPSSGAPVTHRRTAYPNRKPKTKDSKSKTKTVVQKHCK